MLKFMGRRRINQSKVGHNIWREFIVTVIENWRARGGWTLKGRMMNGTKRQVPHQPVKSHVTLIDE